MTPKVSPLSHTNLVKRRAQSRRRPRGPRQTRDPTAKWEPLAPQMKTGCHLGYSPGARRKLSDKSDVVGEDEMEGSLRGTGLLGFVLI